ncbi:MAG: isocitrate/isopropylmalate dehydrogenase family protein [Planctomycetia bacterium]|nr:isocitrate/isopropylmalate dehydrogenase family protein [Planctomycetia bacterium]
MSTPVVLIPGDGIGPEVTVAMKEVLAAAGADVTWVESLAGLPAVERFGDPLPNETLDQVRRYRVALKGPCTTPIGKGFRSINVKMRQDLDLYASVRPVATLPGVNVPYDNVDLVVVRENTEGLYSGQEHIVVPGIVESLRIVTRTACERIVRYAFELARRQGRESVTFCHKADVMPLSDGLFLSVAREVADEYPFVRFGEIHVDRLCMALAQDPSRYDVLVMENLFGDVLSDLCAGLVGGLGLVPGANIGVRYAVFEAVHGTAPDIAGKGVANPIALILSAALMLEHIGQLKIATKVQHAVRETLRNRVGLTRDLGGEGNTATITKAIVSNLG